MAKVVAPRPEWLKTSQVADIYSVSSCISDTFAYYIDYWQHNGYWLFDSPEIIAAIASEHRLRLGDATMFYYELHDSEYDVDTGWLPFHPDAAFATNVVAPDTKQLHGFDVVSFSGGTCAECSPLSCNGMAETLAVNQHCLLASLDDAIRHLEAGQFNDCEPGPYRLFAVHSVPFDVGPNAT